MFAVRTAAASAVFAFSLAPLPLLAGFEITEIAYDLEGADSGREWVEVRNNGGDAADLSGWKLYENDTNHRLTPQGDDAVVAAGSYAVIADDAEQFRSDWPAFEGFLFDSSFSLKNTSEYIALRDAELNDEDSVTYTSEWGAQGDGNSLQKNESGEWSAAAPTPGRGFAGGGAKDGYDETNDGGSAYEDGGSSSGDDEAASNAGYSRYYTQTPSGTGNAADGDAHIKAFIETPAGRDSADEAVAFAGVKALFEGSALGLKDEPLENARYIWNFGDGSVKEGQNVLHTYRAPGKYIAVLDVASGEYAASDRIVVRVVPPRVFIESVGGESGVFSITVRNDADYEIDLFGWMLKSEKRYFMFPQSSILPPRASVAFPAEATGLSYSGVEPVALLFSNGGVASRHIPEERGAVERFAASMNEPELGLKQPPVERRPAAPAAPTASAEAELPFGKEDESVSGGGKRGAVHQTAAAAIGTAENGKSGNIFSSPWLLALLFIIAAGAAWFVFMRKSESPASLRPGTGSVEPEERLAEKMKIEEER